MEQGKVARDFTLDIFKKLLQAGIDEDYIFTSYENYLDSESHNKVFILRHDVDRKPQNAYRTALIENQMGITGTYYFRTTGKSFNEDLIEQIIKLGHEIGYHYEDFALNNGNLEKSIQSFEKNLTALRKFYPVKTICMHGSPLSKWDNRKMWEYFDYKRFDIIADPYFDIDFNTILYLSDTGRTWDNQKGNVRDKVNTKLNLNLSSTFDIISALREKKLPSRILLNLHPQRWTDDWFHWTVELISQKVKNKIKDLV